ncbi:MAG TPA: hypothetical protein PKE06_06625 [Flavilitoribacter sp.]|nr:hypothetical protein [Flavilitoribacter sp.]HMQ90484.1 hypothetical protein [Flavilitoribacter sp.]
MNENLYCPNCNSLIPAADINIASLVAKCNHCNSVFSFDRQVSAVPERSYKRAEVMLPRGFEAFSTLSALDVEISWRQTSDGMGFLLFFTLFWNFIVFIFVFIGLASGEYKMLLFISVHLLVGVSLLYYVIATFVNKTYIQVSRRQVSIVHTPLKLPFYKDKSIFSNELDQLYVQRYVASTTNGQPNHAFALQARLKNGREIRLIKGLKHPDQAAYLEQQIEKFLTIEDRPMEGEYN